jgi:RimJ/RimL family protein N-acetyltransferase
VVKRILANAYVYNKPSLGLINKLGFTSIGTKDNEEYFILDI